MGSNNQSAGHRKLLFCVKSSRSPCLNRLKFRRTDAAIVLKTRVVLNQVGFIELKAPSYGSWSITRSGLRDVLLPVQKSRRWWSAVLIVTGDTLIEHIDHLLTLALGRCCCKRHF